MKVIRISIVTFLFVVSCTQPKPQLPDLSWTSLDEPPRYPDCLEEDPVANWTCFTTMLQGSLATKFQHIRPSIPLGVDTLFITLKVDTTGQLYMLDAAKQDTSYLHKLVLPLVSETLSDLPHLTPAFKTNLEVPVEVTWTLPVYITK